MTAPIDRVCWCGAKEADPWFPAKETRWIVTCRGCGVSALWPVPTVDELRNSYAPDYYGTTARKFIEPVARFVELFQRRRASSFWKAVGIPGRILDVGCGNGGVLRFLRQGGFHVEGTEWSSESAARVPSEEIMVHVGDLMDLNLDPSRYDAVILWHALEHMRDPFATLRECHRILADNGILFLSVPNAGSWQARLFRSAWFHLDAPRHLYHFDMNSLLLLFDRTGFALQRANTWSLEQNPYALVQSLLNAVGFPHQRAYSLFAGTSTSHWATKILDVALVSLLVPPASLLSVIESTCRRGGTLSIQARARDL